ncbi:MAG: hypothetical protein SH819_07865 [Cytophagales bacterium]|nr:hypothetical protein [Cytophagales bacterium]
MKNRSLSIAVLVVLVFLLLSTRSQAQFSFGAHFGYAVSSDGGDSFPLDRPWRTSYNSPGQSSGGGAMVVGEAGSGPSLNFNLTWEASRILGISLVYRTITLTMPQTFRTASSNSLGVQFKVNFVKNTRQVVPFLQAGFYFTNSNKVNQSKAVSTQYPTQTIPGFEKSYSSSLGISSDFGVEFKLSQPVSLVVQVGLHGADFGSSDDTFAKALNMNTSNPSPNIQYTSPTNFDGAFWIQATGGIKYYVGRGKKKRDF